MNGLLGLRLGDLWVTFLSMIVLVYLLGWLVVVWFVKVYNKRS